MSKVKLTEGMWYIITLDEGEHLRDNLGNLLGTKRLCGWAVQVWPDRVVMLNGELFSVPLDRIDTARPMPEARWVHTQRII